jgi:hypothetical protein
MFQSQAGLGRNDWSQWEGEARNRYLLMQQWQNGHVGRCMTIEHAALEGAPELVGALMVGD